MFYLQIERDKNCFGTWRAVTETYYKTTYRIKNGEVQTKHSGKWYNVEECDESIANSLREFYTDYGFKLAPGTVRRVFI